MRCQCDQNQNPSRAGFTLVELLVVIGIIGILLGMLVPAVFEVMEASKTTTCMRKLKEQHGFYMQAVNTAGRKVKANTVRIFTKRFVPKGSAGAEIWGCEADPLFDIDDVENTISYGYNVRLHRLSRGQDNRRIVALDYNVPIVEVVGWSEDGSGVPHGDWDANVAPRHRNKVNVLFHSGTVKTMRPEDIDPSVADYQITHWLPRGDRIGMNLYDQDDKDSFIPVKDFDPLPDPPANLGTYGLEPEVDDDN